MIPSSTWSAPVFAFPFLPLTGASVPVAAETFSVLVCPLVWDSASEAVDLRDLGIRPRGKTRISPLDF